MLKIIFRLVTMKTMTITTLKNDYSNCNNRTVNDETNDTLNNISERINGDSSCRNKNHKNRKRNLIWFNLTFCKLSTNNNGTYFLRLID